MRELQDYNQPCKEHNMASITKYKKADGTFSFYARIRKLGQAEVKATFPNKTLAKNWIRDTEAAIAAGRYFDQQEATKHTVNDMLKKYEKKIMPKKARSTMLSQKPHLAYWKKEIGKLTLADINSDLISEHEEKLLHTKTSRGEQRAPATVNRYIFLLIGALSVAVKEWKWITENPLKDFKSLDEDNERERFLSKDEQLDNGEIIKGERTRLLEACRNSDNKLLYPAVVLALGTGARRMEIMNLKWSDIDMQRGMIALLNTKNKQRRALYITGHVLEVIKEMRKVQRIDSDLLFPAKAKKVKEGQKAPKVTKPFDLRRAFTSALKEAGIEDFRWHDLRHTAASYLVMNGASLTEIAEILGHKTLQMVQRYSHMSETHVHGVVKDMNKSMFGENGNG